MIAAGGSMRGGEVTGISSEVTAWAGASGGSGVSAGGFGGLAGPKSSNMPLSSLNNDAVPASVAGRS